MTDIDIRFRGLGASAAVSEAQQVAQSIRGITAALHELAEAQETLRLGGGMAIPSAAQGGIAAGAAQSVAAQQAARGPVSQQPSPFVQSSGAPGSTAHMADERRAIDDARHSTTQLSQAMHNAGNETAVVSERLQRLRDQAGQARMEVERLHAIREATPMGGSGRQGGISGRALVEVAEQHTGGDLGAAQRLIAQAHEPAAVSAAEAEARRLQGRVGPLERQENLRRIRPGEEIDAAQHRAQLESEQRAQRAARQAESVERRGEMDFRRDSFNRLYAGSIMMGVGGGILGGLGEAGFGAFGKAQMAGVGLRAVEGSNADAVMKQAKADAGDVFGAGYREIIQLESQLRQAGEGTKDAREMTLALSDVNAAVGGTGDSLHRLVHNLSQVDNQGRLTARDMRDFSTNLVPIQEFLAKHFGIQRSEVAEKVTRREVGAEDVHAAIRLMEADPRFHNRGKDITENTLPGQLEKFHEEAEQTAEVVGEVLAPSLRKLLDVARGGLEFLRVHPGVVTAGTYAAAGLGTVAAVGGAYNLTRGGLGMVGQVMPDKWMDNKFVNAIFGGGDHQRAAAMQVRAATMQLEAAGGRAIGGGGATSTAASAAAGIPWNQRPVFNAATAGGMALGGPLTRGGATLTYGGLAAGAVASAAGGYVGYSGAQNMGVSDAGAVTAGLAEAAGLAVVSMFVPGGPIVAAFVVGAQMLFNSALDSWKQKQDDDASNNPGGEPTLPGGLTAAEQSRSRALAASQSPTARAAEYTRMAQDERNKADLADKNIEGSGVDDAEVYGRERDTRNKMADFYLKKAAAERKKQQYYQQFVVPAENSRQVAQDAGILDANGNVMRGTFSDAGKFVPSGQEMQGKVTGVQNHDDLGQTLTVQLLVPPHPQVAAAVQDQYQRGE